MFPLLIAQTVTETCGADPGAVCSLILDLTGNSSAARVSDFAARPIKVLIILLLAWIANRIVRRWLDRAVEGWLARRTAVAEEIDEVSGEASVRMDGLREAALRRARRMVDQQERSSQRTRTLGAVLRSIAAMVIYGLAVMMSLGEFDVNLGPLIAGAGIVGVAVGFGAKSLVEDFLSGVFMLLEDQYGVGDVVDVGDTAGVVEEVKLRTTQVRDINGTLWHIPNGAIRRVANMTQDWGRAVLDIEVAYDTDIAAAAAVIKEVADGMWREQLPQRYDHRGAIDSRSTGFRRERHRYPAYGQDGAGRAMVRRPGTAGEAQGRLRRGGYRDPVPAAHCVGTERSSDRRDGIGYGRRHGVSSHGHPGRSGLVGGDTSRLVPVCSQ